MMKRFSFFATLLICTIYVFHRVDYSDINSSRNLKVTTWDALGYYMYLPSIIIYNDYKQLKWFPAIDSQYHVSGGELYQALKHKNGNYFYKYLGGVSILQLPFFLTAHCYAKNTSHYKADGFSPPYQYAIAFGNIIYFIMALFFLRKFLLLFFNEEVTTATLLLTTLATNIIQYVAVDGGMSHGYIFPLYVFILWVTYKWHQKPKPVWAFLIGYIIGLATISRPTEAVMLFIPLLWNTHTKEIAKQKWKAVKENKSHILITIICGFIGILPQLIYWKSVTGSWVYDVGSKWTFLNPFFRVLVGWEKGWFIYTPVTIFFIVGLFFVKKLPFKNSVIWFCILNIYIIISWFDWRYGGTYCTLALSHHSPIFSLSLAAFIHYLKRKKIKWLFYAVSCYLIAVNLFQIWQYNKTILHYNDMNRKYYGPIYLDANPTSLDMSLLDTDEFLKDSNLLNDTIIMNDATLKKINATDGNPYVIIDTNLSSLKADWFKVELKIYTNSGFWNSDLIARINDSVHNFRMDNPLSKEGIDNKYAFYLKCPSKIYQKMKIFIQSPYQFSGKLKHIKITAFSK